MSRFVRASKYRHVFGQNAKKEHGLENVKVSGSAWDTNLIAASGKYISVNWNASGGGAFAILPAPSPFGGAAQVPYKLPDIIPLARSHTAPVLDTDWSPHDDALVASAGEDGKVMLWQVRESDFDGWGADGWAPRDFEPALRIDASARKIGQVLWHPTAQHALASAAGDYTVKLWDVGAPEAPKVTLGGHGDMVQSMAFNATGALLVTTCRDRKLRIFDPRAGGDAVRVADGHGGIKASRVAWMGNYDRIATTGFSKMSDRQVGIWETGGLGNVKTMALDQTAGVVMPFWSDNNILFLAGKGDGNVRYYEYENDALFALSEYKSGEPQRGMCFLPRRALSTNDCEIARAYKISGTTVEPIAFIVPRKADSFQSDIFPPAPSIEPSTSAADFFAGKSAPVRLVDLETGSVSAAPPGAISIPPPSPAPAPTRTATAPIPSPAPAPVAASPMTKTASEPVPTPVTPAAVPVPETPAPKTPAAAPLSASPPAQSQQDNGLAEENARLNSELRDARAQIRALELQVESMKANARKAAEALMSAH